MYRLLPALALAAALLTASDSASAQPASAPLYPNKPVRLLVGFPPGAAADNVSRIIANALSPALGQSVIVENKPGAESAIAAEATAKSAPDGYTIMFASSSNMAAAPALRKDPPYDPTSDFTPISLIGHGTFLLFTHPSVPATNLAELIAYGRANPDQLNYATGNPIAIIATAQFMKATGLRMMQVPYKGEAPAIPDLIAGRVQLEFVATVAVALPHVSTGRLRVLAAMADRRSPLAPDVPTLAELGMGEFDIAPWFGVVVPAGTPRPIVERMNAEIAKALHSPDVAPKLATQIGMEILATSPEAFVQFQAVEQERWSRIIRDNGIKAE